MISDALFEAGEEIDRCLVEMADVYREPVLRAWIVQVREQMRAIQRILDTAPAPSKSFADFMANFPTDEQLLSGRLKARVVTCEPKSRKKTKRLAAMGQK